MPLALLPPWVALLAALIFTGLGYWALTHLPETGADPGWVVVDEAAGQSLALAAATGWVGVLLAFALFRLFDITKPGLVGWADRQKGPFGVMADDVIAGAMEAATLLATLQAKHLTIATAESCTGGLIAAALTAIPGSSASVLAGFVTYSNEAKTSMLGVPAEMIERHGAVSEEVARQMVEG
eukprot:gene50023-61225_t